MLDRKLLAKVAGIATPDTILGWYRRLVAAKYDGSKKRGPGRPATKPDLAALVVEMAKKTGWGYTKLVGAMKPLGHEIGRNTVKRILLNHGIAPAPERKTSWKTFLAAHLDAMAAADFFTVEVLTLFGLVRFSVLFVMQLKTRTVEIAGITSQPSEAWMMQVARNLTDAVDGFLLDMRYLILDRDPLYTAAFRQMLKDSGVEVVRLPARSPNLNAFCERHVLSIKSECLSRIVLLGEAHLRVAIGQYLEHYHGERPHQGLGNRLILQPDKPTAATGPVRCRERLGGILSYYYRDAA